MLSKWNFKSYQSLQQTYPIWKDWWSATIYDKTYSRNIRSKRWDLTNSSVDWWNILWDILDQTDLINYIEQNEIRYPKDYISPTETVEIRQYENYGGWNPLINDWILINSWTLIVN